MQGIFIQLHNLGRNQKGQAAPFLIMLIAALLACMMVVFNVGKVSLNRVDTQNAADAGALASASWLASGENKVADISQIMFAASSGFVAMMYCITWGPGPWPAWAVIVAFSAVQMNQYLGACEVADKAHQYAQEAGRQYAFINAGIDEKKTAQSGETYEQWRERDSEFNSWLKNGGYKDSSEYSWQDTRYEYWDSRSQQFVRYKEDLTNRVRVDVDAPHLSLIPMLMPGLTWYWIQVGTVTVILPLPYAIPIAFIAGISPNNPETTVVTTRQEPGADLGLWDLQIPDIASGATAKTTGGGVIFVQGGDYDCKLTGAW